MLYSLTSYMCINFGVQNNGREKKKIEKEGKYVSVSQRIITYVEHGLLLSVYTLCPYVSLCLLSRCACCPNLRLSAFKTFGFSVGVDISEQITIAPYFFNDHNRRYCYYFDTSTY